MEQQDRYKLTSNKSHESSSTQVTNQLLSKRQRHIILVLQFSELTLIINFHLRIKCTIQIIKVQTIIFNDNYLSKKESQCRKKSKCPVILIIFIVHVVMYKKCCVVMVLRCLRADTIFFPPIRLKHMSVQPKDHQHT